LLAETKIVRDVLYGLSGFEQVEHLSAKSSRILTHHEFLSVESTPQFHQTDSEKPRAHQNLQQAQSGSAWEMNDRPRKRLDYLRPNEMIEPLLMR